MGMGLAPGGTVWPSIAPSSPTCAMMASVRSGGWLAAASIVVVLVPTTSATAVPAPRGEPADLVMANGSGSDFQMESATTGMLVKDLGAVANYTNNGLALSPDGDQVYATVTMGPTIMIERITVANDQETFVADGVQPAVSPNGRLLAFGTGPSGRHPSFGTRPGGRHHQVHRSGFAPRPGGRPSRCVDHAGSAMARRWWWSPAAWATT